MPGLGYRVFTAGEQLTAANMQNYLQDQSVMRFASSAARGSALAGVLSEGMISYLDDTNKVQLYNGTAWADITPDVQSATPGTAGIVFGRTNGSTDTTYSLVLGFGSGGAARPNPSFIGNVVVGVNSASGITTGNSNTIVGSQTALSLTTGQANVYIGNSTGTLLSSDSDNTMVGSGTGFAYTTPSAGNTFIGSGAGGLAFGTHTGNNNTFLGQGAVASSTTVSNQITLGNSSVTSLRCNVTSISSLSDERDKKNITDLSHGLDFIKTLRPVEFVWNTRIPEGYTLPDGTSKEFTEADVRRDVADIGFIAQELLAAEDAVDAHDSLQLTLRDNPERLEATQGRLIPILVKAIQELSAEVESLKAQLG